MSEKFILKLEDIFRVQHGQIIFAGRVVSGKDVPLNGLPCVVKCDGVVLEKLVLENQCIPLKSTPVQLRPSVEPISVSTRDPIEITREQLQHGECTLESIV